VCIKHFPSIIKKKKKRGRSDWGRRGFGSVRAIPAYWTRERFGLEMRAATLVERLSH